MASQSEDASSKRIWANNPQRDERLLAWMDGHPVEKNILFSKTGYPRRRKADKSMPSSKGHCYMLASKAVFSEDENPEIREAVAKNPHHFAISTQNHIHSWIRKYQQFNEEIGADASNLAVEDIKVGTQAHKAVEAQLEYFPLWKRLHIHWRTYPHINVYYYQSEEPDQEQGSVAPPVTPAPATPKRRRTASKKLAASGEISQLDHEVEVIVIDNEEESQEDSDVKPTPGGSKRKRDHADLDDNPRGILNPAQKHERYMAELALKLQEKKNETEIRRLELASEERRRLQENQHEIMKLAIQAGNTLLSNLAVQPQ
ncbi:hypothetical protein GALMADRAFT_155716 [Galerina marginata CBS 339.88]|uniref:No apical meristem-associated C-terminal domain-containing protein n=1 Tax=Galerina marginata (strain CBS 339.88) TaxID=685588 RepID=A0A067TAZ4_GALM3|nr:hypothetical protein GALMADRAFT_155716 [Galerina marginata CBS 339.88]